MAPKPKPFKKIIETIVKQKRQTGNLDPAVVLRVPTRNLKHQDVSEINKKNVYYEVSKDVNRFKSKTDLELIDEMRKTILIDVKKKFGNSTLIQIKDNVRDSKFPKIPNSLPRRSSVLGIINAFKKQGITNFAIAITDVKTGKVMGYTVIGISKPAGESIKKKFNYDLEKSEGKFNSYIDNFIGKGELPEQYYEEALKEVFGFNIKHLSMPGHTIDSKTRDFRSKTIKERLGIKK
ncbi:MAG: hypothetical protein WCX82_00395 [archaeon]|jgi:hypothetical protein